MATTVSSHSAAKLKVDQQNWIVVNIVGPGLRQKTKDSAFIILGAFNDEAEAKAHAEKYKLLDDTYDLYVAKMYEFLPVLNEVHDVGEVKYSDTRVNDLLEVHQATRTQTEDWDRRIENAKKTGQDAWGLQGL